MVDSKICPLRFTKEGVPQPCLQDGCAWWQMYYNGDRRDEEFSDCVINNLACLLSLNTVYLD